MEDSVAVARSPPVVPVLEMPSPRLLPMARLSVGKRLLNSFKSILEL